MTKHTLLRTAPALALASLSALTGAQEAPPSRTTPVQGPTSLPAGTTREQMWSAPTAEDWKKPCLVQWQRTWEDAVEVSLATKKAILICVNMDGEIASEHYAGVRYRQPDIAALYEPYVCVIASVYRHTPRDYDEHGQRVVCPRFGTVTCGEHIAIEPLLHDQYFDNTRVAPRHIMIELDKSEVYDVYYAFDTKTVFESLKIGIANRPPPPPLVRSEMPIVDRVESPDVFDRLAVESAFVQGDATLRRQIVERAARMAGRAPVEVLRMAIFDLDLENGKLARQALARTEKPEAVELINDALRVPMSPDERDALIAALERLGASSPRAKTLAAVHKGLASRSDAVDFEGLTRALSSAPVSSAPKSRDELEARLDGRGQTYDAKPDDGTARLEFAEASLALAVDPATPRKFARVMLEDARNAALDAEKQGLNGRRASTVLAIAAYHMGERKEAHRLAEAAVNGMPADASDWSTAAVLAIFAEARERAIIDATRAKAEWPPQHLTDIHAAYAVLARHPHGTDANVASHYDFLKWLGGAAQAGRVLDEGLSRFPDSWVLHDRLRGRILAEKGVAGLETSYADMLRTPSPSASLVGYAGYASLVAAEHHRRAGMDAEADAAYDRGIALYERALSTKPEDRATFDHFVAMALAGKARLAFTRAEDDAALELIVASLQRCPTAAASPDGLNLTAVDTAKSLRARLEVAKRTDAVAKLQAALDALDPELLNPPAYEREVPGSRRNIRLPTPRTQGEGGETPR